MSRLIIIKIKNFKSLLINKYYIKFHTCYQDVNGKEFCKGQLQQIVISTSQLKIDWVSFFYRKII